MSVTSTNNVVRLTANGTTGPFPFNFRIDQATDLQVVVKDAVTKVETVKVLNTDYTIPPGDIGNPTGGNVTFVSGRQPNAGDTLTLKRVVPLTQGVDYTPSGNFPAETHEAALDKLTFAAQQLDETLQRALKVPVSSSTTNVEVPDPALSENYGKYLRIKATGGSLEAVAGTPSSGSGLLTTKGDLLSHTGLVEGRVPVGAADNVLLVDLAQSFGLKWDTLSAWLDRRISNAVGTLLRRDATGWSALAAGTNGQLLGVNDNAAGKLTYFPTLEGYIDGLILENNATDPTNDIDFGPGVAEVGGLLIKNSTTMTKRLDAAWAAGHNAGGLFSGTKAASTWYHCFVMCNTTTGAVDFGFSTSVTGSDAPSGWSVRRIGAVRTNSSAAITRFLQYGDQFLWSNSQLDVLVSNPGIGPIQYTISVPTGLSCWANVRINLRHSGATEAMILLVTSPLTTSETPTELYTDSANSAVATGSVRASPSTQQYVLTNTAAQIRINIPASDNTGVDLSVRTRGWIDPRGRRW